jgi:hypothetical protein
MPTTRDSVRDRWQLTDDVFRMRELATADARVLPQSAVRELSIGSAKNAWWRVQDIKERVSLKHGVLFREDGKWILRDSGSTNGISFAGHRYNRLVLEPAQEIGIGGVTIITESNLSIALHAYLSRILGWKNILAVDLALRALRVAAMRETALVLCGEDLVSVARSIHCKALGVDRPFVYCGPANVGLGRSVVFTEDGTSGLAASRNGTLCLVNEKLPGDYLSVNRAFQDPDTRAMLMVCSKRTLVIHGVHSIEIPPLSSREKDIPRIITEYAADAKVALGIEHSEFPSEYVDWIREKHAKTLEQIARSTERLVALQATSSIYAAAKIIGISGQGLHRWIGQHGMPPSLEARQSV